MIDRQITVRFLKRVYFLFVQRLGIALSAEFPRRNKSTSARAMSANHFPDVSTAAETETRPAIGGAAKSIRVIDLWRMPPN
jgi:hypothetical protein